MMSWLPENISIEGQEVDYLFYIIYYITAVILILVAGFMFYFLVRYRQKPGRFLGCSEVGRKADRCRRPKSCTGQADPQCLDPRIPCS